MRRTAACSFLIFSLPLFASGAETDDGRALALKVRAIFEEKCTECHGADLRRPKGKFGYVLDLGRVAANPDYVVPHKPGESELYRMIDEDEMPGDEASVPPLTSGEKQIVRRWIDLGAPDDVLPVPAAAVQIPPKIEQADSPEALAAAPPVSKQSQVPAKRSFTTWQRIIRFLGQFHPPSSHFPIALLIAALPAEAMWKLTRKHSWKSTVRFCVVLGAAGAVVTASLGWCDAAFSNYTGASAPLLWWHRWLGTGTALWALGTALLSEFAHKEGHPRALCYAFRLTLLGGIVLVSISGYLGASLIYGLDHFKW